MIESVTPAPCGAYFLHEPHKYYTGFLGWKTNKCPGLNMAEVPTENIEESSELLLQIVDHKHDFKLTEAFPFGPKQDSDILWKCDWFDCKHYYVIDRDLWWIDGVKYDVY